MSQTSSLVQVYQFTSLPQPGEYYNTLGDFTEVDFANFNPAHKHPKIIFIGNPAVGKTTLIETIRTGKYDERYHATISVAFTVISSVINGHNVDVHVWDTAGSDNHKTIVTKYFRNTDVACICFDVSNPSSFEDVQNWFDLLVKNVGEMPTVFLVGCKTDLQAEVRDETIRDFCTQHSAEYFATSSKNRIHLREFTERICLAGALYNKNDTQLQDIQTIEITPPQESKEKETKRTTKCCS